MPRDRIILLTDQFSEEERHGDRPGPVPYLVPVDLSRGNRGDHPDLRSDQDYLYKVHGHWHVGRPHRQWYGWNFSGWWGTCIQFDTPGTNGSTWEYIYELHDEHITGEPNG